MKTSSLPCTWAPRFDGADQAVTPWPCSRTTWDQCRDRVGKGLIEIGGEIASQAIESCC